MTDEQRFADLRARIMRHLRWRFRTVDHSTLEDAAQHALIELWTRRDRLEGDMGGYGCATADHHVLRMLRRAPVADERERVDPTDLFDHVVARDEIRALSNLRSRQRTALTARMIGLSYRQIEQATGHSRTWVNKHTYRGRAAWREEVGV